MMKQPKLKNKFPLLTVGLLLLAGCFHQGRAQKGELQVNVQFRIIELGFNELEKRVDPVFKFYLGKEDGVLLNGTGLCYKFSSKSSTNSFLFPDPKYPGWEYLKPFNVPVLSRSSFTVTMECFSDNKGEGCMYDKKDEYHSITAKTIDLNEFTPGDYSDTFRIKDKDNHFWSKVEFRYSLVRPNKIKTAGALQPVNAADKNIVLSSSYELPNKDKLKFVWEYSDDKGASWSRLATSGDDHFSLTVNPLKELFGGRLTTTEHVLFRFRVNSRDTFAVSDTLEATFTAVPPSFPKDDVRIAKTCKGYENGAIAVSNIHYVKNKALYILRKASESKNACNLSGPTAATCSGLVRSGEITNGSMELKNLPADSYSLLLYNPDLQVGTVYTVFDFTVQAYQPLSVSKVVQRNPNCFDANAGEIKMNMEGGSNKEAWQVGLVPNVSKLELDQNEIAFKNLPEGSYTLEVIDGCGEQVTKNFALKRPEKLLIESIKVRKLPEQALIINLRNGSGRYKAIISDRNQYVKIIDSLVNNILPISQKGIFRIQIFDKTDPECLSVDTVFSVTGAYGMPSKVKAGLQEVPVYGKCKSFPVNGIPVMLLLLAATLPDIQGQHRV